MSIQQVLLESNLPLPIFSKGKVRDTYQLGDKLLIVTTDRISAFDVVLPCGIPDKGMVLNRLSAFWFRRTENIIANHLIELVEDIGCLDKYLPVSDRFKYPSYLEGRSMVVKKANVIPVECVVRGYISGSAWVEYSYHGTVNGKPLPEGLEESERLNKPLFTPTTKAEFGHDLPIGYTELEEIVGSEMSRSLREKSLDIYEFARNSIKDIIVADTKMEFGLDGEELVIVDELLTPDSSRFWDVELYRVGQPQPSYDKQPVRDWLSSSGWNKEPPAPMLPPEVIEATTQRYQEAFERITGTGL